jgi:hypothetical protein
VIVAETIDAMKQMCISVLKLRFSKAEKNVAYAVEKELNTISSAKGGSHSLVRQLQEIRRTKTVPRFSVDIHLMQTVKMST